MFGETLRYASPQKPGTTERFDGNISEITYASYNGIPAPSSDTYGFAYDGLGRLTDAAHYAGAATTQSLLKTEKDITYDRNGNITGLNRYGAAGLSEMLSFTHAGNRLSSVQAWDGANLPQIGTFTYDAMGNQLTDSRKGLQFSYNFANLPSKVEGSAGSGNAGLTLNYGYLSDGTKTSAITETAAGSSAEGLKYRGAFVYELKDGAERLSSIAWSDGRIEYVYAPAAVVVDDGPGGDEIIEGGDGDELLEVNDLWHIPDHLGNTRAVVLLDYSGGTVLEQNEYLPFGTRIADPVSELTTNRYRLGGKEEQRFGGLDLALSDFGARYYDPFTARWTTRDPLAGKYHSLSPYNYCAGNPVNLVDPMGAMMGDYYNLQGKRIGTDGLDDNKNYFVLNQKEQQIVKKNDKINIPTPQGELSSSVPVPSDNVVNTMEECFNLTEQTGNEHGFRIGMDGTVTSIVEGTAEDISNWEQPMAELRGKKEYAAYDVHTHPQGNPSKYGKPEPSDTDKQSIIKSSGLPSVVLGYTFIQTSTGEYRSARVIGYYNSSGIIGSATDFNQYKRVVRKINNK